MKQYKPKPTKNYQYGQCNQRNREPINNSIQIHHMENKKYSENFKQTTKHKRYNPNTRQRNQIFLKIHLQQTIITKQNENNNNNNKKKT